MLIVRLPSSIYNLTDPCKILKVLAPPSMNEFDDLIAEARKQARNAGLKKSDIAKAKLNVRRRR